MIITSSHSILAYKFIAILSAVGVVFFSYMPFLYFFSLVNVEKSIIFSMVIALILILTLAVHLPYILKGKLSFHQSRLTAFSLYMLFALYALASFFILSSRQDDFFTIRTIALINPIFAVFALLSLKNKRDVVLALYILSMFYFVLLLWSLKEGNISLSSPVAQNIFSDIEGILYQNINMYLGLFAICGLRLLEARNRYVVVAYKLVVLLTMVGMFIIGGRSSVVALFVVLLIYYFHKVKNLSLSPRRIATAGVIVLVCVVAILVNYGQIANLSDSLITLNRFVELAEGDDSSLRLFLFSNAVGLFLSDIKTIILGAGINGFPAYIGAEPDGGMYPHNIVLELLAEYGVTGTLLFFAPVIYILSVRKNILGSIYGDELYERITFLLFVYFLLIFLFSGGMGTSWFIVFFLFLLYPNRNKQGLAAKPDITKRHILCLRRT